MGMSCRTDPMFQICKHHLACLPFRIERRDGVYTFFDKIFQVHRVILDWLGMTMGQEFSMTVVRKSVMSMPAARTI